MSSVTVSLSWTDNNNSESTLYELESAETGEWAAIYVGTAAAYIHSGLVPNTTHNYRVRAISLEEEYTDYNSVYYGIDWSTHTLCNVPGLINFDNVYNIAYQIELNIGHGGILREILV